MQPTHPKNQADGAFVSYPTLVSLKLKDESQLKTVSKLLHSSHIKLVDDANISIAAFVDGQNLDCPQPLLQTKIGLRALPAGTYLYMVATDSNSMHDMIAFTNQKQLELIQWQTDDIFHFLIK